MKANGKDLYYTSKIRIFHETPSFGPGVVRLLEQVERYGSIQAACGEMNMAYSKAWKILKAAEKDMGISLLCRVTGGKGGGSSQLTEEGRILLERYRSFSSEVDRAIKQQFLRHFHDYMPEEAFLYRNLQLSEQVRIISLIGGGGKTSAMYRLAREYASLGKKVLLTTSTHIIIPSPEEVPILLYYPVSAEQLADAFSRSPVVALGTKDRMGKLAGVPFSFLEKALETADLIICEADGAKKLPVKVPAAHEPVIVPGSDAVVAVAGLTALDSPLKEVCHRKELAAKLLGCKPSAILDEQKMARILTDPQGLMKGLEGETDKVRILLNQADTPELREKGERIRNMVQQMTGVPVFVGALRESII